MFIALVSVHPYPSPQAVPLANAFLRSYLDTLAITTTPLETELMDFFIGQEIAACANDILATGPAAVGFSLYVWNRAICQEMARELRIRKPGITLFAGGPEATADPGALLAEEAFDFLIVGEGEQPFADACAMLAKGESLTGIPGIATLGRNGLELAPSSPLPDLDVIPSPWLSGALETSRYRGILWQLSRGCAFSCDFCFDSRDRNVVRSFSLSRIEAELRHFVASGISQIFVLDSTFNKDKRRAKAILRLIRKIAPRIHFHFEVRSEFIDLEMSQLFAEIICSLQIGLQSSDPMLLKDIGRSFNPEDFIARVGLLNRSGAVFGFDLIYGLPGDTFDGFGRSLDFALRLYPNHLDIFPLAILPGTALAGRCGVLGLQHLPAPPYTMISSPSFSAEHMEQARLLANACDIFYTRGKAVAWFNSVLLTLRLRPSDFLHQFGDWLAIESSPTICETDLVDDRIWQMQRRFLKKLFSPKRLRRLLPLVLDLIDYHHHYSAALLIPPTDTSQHLDPSLVKLLEIPARLAPTTRLAPFTYEILDILDAGEPNIRNFVDHFTPDGSWAAIYPDANEIRTESLIEPYFRLLENLDGHSPTGMIASRLGIPANEALTFLEFAASEGIIVPA